MAAPGTRKRQTAAERRSGIVAAAIALADDLGPAGVTTQAIAGRLGLTHGALFRHFPDKEAIWAGVFDWVEAALGEAISAALAQDGSPLARIEAVFMAHVGFIATHPGVPRILYHELQRPAGSPLRERVGKLVAAYRNRLCRLIEAAMEAGELPQGIDVEAAAVLFVGTVQGLVVQHALFHAGTTLPAAARRIFPLLLDGLRGPQVPAPRKARNMPELPLKIKV